jgi:hypothetical protein
MRTMFVVRKPEENRSLGRSKGNNMEDTYWIRMAQDRYKLRTLVDAVLDTHVP